MLVAPVAVGANGMVVETGERPHVEGDDLIPPGPTPLPDQAIEAQPGARGIPQPKEPTPEERAAHELTHLPAVPWCQACILGRGRDEAHREAQ